MKRIIAIVLLCTFLFATGTMRSITLHYCAGDLASVSFGKTVKGCGGCKTSKEGCCKDVVKIIKTDQYNKITFVFDFSQHLIALPAVSYNTECLQTSILPALHNTVYANAPPSVHKEPYFILYRSLVI